MRGHYMRCIDHDCERASCVDRRMNEHTAKVLRSQLATQSQEIARLREALGEIENSCECTELCECSSRFAEIARKALSEDDRAAGEGGK